jgi:hypothetical protein
MWASDLAVAEEEDHHSPGQAPHRVLRLAAPSCQRWWSRPAPPCRHSALQGSLHQATPGA